MSANLFGNFLTVAAIPLLILLLIIYYSKNQFDIIRTKLFKLVLYLLLIGGFIEIFTTLLINYEVNKKIIDIFSRIGFAFKTYWWYFLNIYTIAVFENIPGNKIKDVIKYNKFTIGLTIYYLILVICILTIPALSPVKEIDINCIIYMPRFVLGISVFVIGIEFVLAIYYLIKSKNNKELESDKIVLYTVELGIIVYFILQGIFPYVSFPLIIFTVFVYLTYFLNENPDIRILKEINNSQEIIEKSNKTKTEFLSNISYEIKMPMNLIISLCDELNNNPIYNEEEVKKGVKEIVQYGNDLIDIINNILDISKIESGQISVSETNYKINDIISNLINIAQQKIGSKPVQLILNVNQNTSSVLYGDSSKLYQALLNVVTNAVKYTEVGKITIDVLSSKNGNVEHLLFKVNDTGIGIKDEDKEKIFVKGSKLNNNVSVEEEGSGLGLAITKQYIESLGGKIWFESQYRVGTTFYVDIEQKIVDSTPIGSLNNRVKSNSDEKLDCSNRKALIVDDNLLNIKVAKKLLEKYKFTVDCLQNGLDCIDKMKEEEKYDIIFIDHVMPEIDGIETLHVLKGLNQPLPPIIALTANAIVGMKEMYLNEGFDDYLSKPIDTHELDRIVNRFFNK